MQETEIQLIINKITEAQASTMTMNEGELYLAPDNAVYSVNNVAPVNGDVTLDIANKDLSNLSSTGNAKFQVPITGGASTITTSNLTANRALISNSSGKVAVSAVTSSELGYLFGVTSNVQTQLNGKQATLVSGTNIKTINSTSILGNGDISVDDILPSQTSQSGKFLTTDGTTAGWGTITVPTVDQTYDATSTNAQSGVAIAGAKFLKNNSTNTAGTSYIIGGTASGVSNTVCIGSSASTSAYSVVVGQGASSTALYSTAIGSTADSNSQFGTSIGYAAKARATSAIQLGTGINTDANTLSVGFSDVATNFHLLDGTTGLIPDARISSNIARASAIPTQASDIGAQPALVSGTNIKTINSTSLLGSGNIDTSEIFIATYGVTTFRDVLDAFQDDKEILVKDVDIQNTTGSIFYAKLGVMQILDTPVAFWFSYIEGNSIKRYLLEADNSWSVTNLTAETTNNKVTSISSSSTNAQYPSAKCVYDDLQNRADVDLSNLNSTGQAVIDGQWVGVTATLCQSRTSETSNDKSFDVSAYLPSDSNNYEVLLTGAVTTGTTSGNQARINLKSSIISDNIVICNAQTRTNSSVTAYGSCPLAIGTDREVIVQGWSNNTGAYSLYLRGYRRIGTNS